MVKHWSIIKFGGWMDNREWEWKILPIISSNHNWIGFWLSVGRSKWWCDSKINPSFFCIFFFFLFSNILLNSSKQPTRACVTPEIQCLVILRACNHNFTNCYNKCIKAEAEHLWKLRIISNAQFLCAANQNIWLLPFHDARDAMSYFVSEPHQFPNHQKG